MFDVFSNEKTVNEFVKENRSLAERFLSALKTVIDDIKEIVKNLSGYKTWSEIGYLKDDFEALEHIRDMFFKALDEIKNTRPDIDRTDVVFSDGNVSYSLMNKKTLKENITDIVHMNDKEALKRKKAGEYIEVLSYTPSVILDNVKDAKNIKVIIRFDAAYLATRHSGILEGHYHNYGEDFADKLVSVLNNPNAIIRLKNGRLNLLGTVETIKGKDNIVSVELNTVKDVNSEYKAYNLIVSMLPAKSNYIKNLIIKQAKKIEYEKEDLSQVNPQLHESLSIINDKSSVYNIFNSDKNVNRFSEKDLGKALYTVNKWAKHIRDIQDELYSKQFIEDENNLKFLESQFNYIPEIKDKYEVGHTSDSIDDDIREQEITVEMLENDEENTGEDDLEFEKDYLNNLEEIAEQLAKQEEIIKDLKNLKTDAYDIKQKALNKLNLSPIAYHEFNDGSVRPMYRIGDYTFHGTTTEDYPNDVKIEKIDTISAENKLDNKEKITLNEALEIIKNTLDLSPGYFLNDTEILNNKFSAKGNGYDGYSMSNNARDAYANGEMPISKWTKANIISAVSELRPELTEVLKSVNADTLKNYLLKYSSWHHTSSRYNKTDFYSVNEDYINTPVTIPAGENKIITIEINLYAN